MRRGRSAADFTKGAMCVSKISIAPEPSNHHTVRSFWALLYRIAAAGGGVKKKRVLVRCLVILV